MADEDITQPLIEVVPDDERFKLQEFGRGLARMNATVNSLTGVRRGIVVRAFESESRKLDDEKYGNR